MRIENCKRCGAEAIVKAIDGPYQQLQAYCPSCGSIGSPMFSWEMAVIVWNDGQTKYKPGPAIPTDTALIENRRGRFDARNIPLSINSELLEAIDRLALVEHESRSSIMRRLMRLGLDNWPRPLRFEPEGAGDRTRDDHP